MNECVTAAPLPMSGPSRARVRVGQARVDLSQVPSSLEQRAASWRGTDSQADHRRAVDQAARRLGADRVDHGLFYLPGWGAVSGSQLLQIQGGGR